MIIVSEDSKEMPLSKLTSSNAHYSYVFTGGNERLSRCIQKHITELLTVLVDVSPDNLSTIDLYQRLKGTYAHCSNITIIPIPCIEYFAMCLLNKLTAVNEENYVRYILRASLGYPTIYKQKTYERACKYTLNKEIECKHNESKQKISFYLRNCDCPECNYNLISHSVKLSAWSNILRIYGGLEEVYKFQEQMIRLLNNINKALGCPYVNNIV